MQWQPYVATLAEGVYAHRWQDGATVVHTLLNAGAGAGDGPVLEVAAADASGAPLRHYDVWNGRELTGFEREGAAVVSVPLPPGGAGLHRVGAGGGCGALSSRGGSARTGARRWLS